MEIMPTWEYIETTNDIIIKNLFKINKFSTRITLFGFANIEALHTWHLVSSVIIFI